MRPDRLITLGLIRPALRVLKPRRPALPVLMYHSVSADREPGASPYYRLCTPPERFAEQMQWLAAAGLRGVSLTEGLDWLDRGASGISPVVLTFDDGYRDFLTAALPAMQRHGFSATVYLPTAFVLGTRGHFKSRECLTWDEIGWLRRAGVEFGSHTRSHPVLVRLGRAEVEAELRDSKSAIEDRLGFKCDHFSFPYAYPSGDREFCGRFSTALSSAGYRSCVTTVVGRTAANHDRLRLPRLPVNGGDDRPLFLAKLSGAYDWLAGPQFAIRWLKSLRHP